jgi:hypothetical protein
VGRGQHLIEGWTLRFRAADLVDIFVIDFKASLFRQPAQKAS